MPPLTVVDSAPSSLLLQLKGVAVIWADKGVGCVTIALLVAVQPLASVMVTV